MQTLDAAGIIARARAAIDEHEKRGFADEQAQSLHAATITLMRIQVDTGEMLAGMSPEAAAGFAAGHAIATLEASIGTVGKLDGDPR